MLNFARIDIYIYVLHIIIGHVWRKYHKDHPKIWKLVVIPHIAGICNFRKIWSAMMWHFHYCCLVMAQVEYVSSLVNGCCIALCIKHNRNFILMFQKYSWWWRPGFDGKCKIMSKTFGNKLSARNNDILSHYPDSKVHGANMGPTWVLSAQMGPMLSPWTLLLGPPKVLLLCRSWGACVPRRSQRLCQLEFWLLVGTTMLDRLWARGQTKCNTPLMLATSVFGRI